MIKSWKTKAGLSFFLLTTLSLPVGYVWTFDETVCIVSCSWELNVNTCLLSKDKGHEMDEVPIEEEISFYEESFVHHAESRRSLKQTPYQVLSTKKVAKRLFDLYSEMTVDLPVWNGKDDFSWDNSCTESDQANMLNGCNLRSQSFACIPGYVLGPNSFVYNFLFTSRSSTEDTQCIINYSD